MITKVLLISEFLKGATEVTHYSFNLEMKFRVTACSLLQAYLPTRPFLPGLSRFLDPSPCPLPFCYFSQKIPIIVIYYYSH